VLANVVVEGEPPAAVMPHGFASRGVRVLRGGRCGVGRSHGSARNQFRPLPIAVSHPARSPQRDRPVLRVVYARLGYPAVIERRMSPRTRAPASLSLTQITPPSCR